MRILRRFAIFLQIDQKCAFFASVVHAQKLYYTAKSVQINVLLNKNCDETTVDDLIADQNRGLTDELPLDLPNQNMPSVLALHVIFI